MSTITAGTHTDTPPVHDPGVASDGLTLDTDWGPVDLVAVWRIWHGDAVPVTDADRAYIVDLVAQTPGTVTSRISNALHMSGDTFKRAVERRRAALRGQGATA